MLAGLPEKAVLVPVTWAGLLNCCQSWGEETVIPSVATSVTSQMPPLAFSSRRLNESRMEGIDAPPADGFLMRTIARVSFVPPPLNMVAGVLGSHLRTNSAKF